MPSGKVNGEPETDAGQQQGTGCPPDVRRARSRKDPEMTGCSVPPPGGKWPSILDAARSWGSTLRFCVICLVIEAPLLAWPLLRH
jgi:hypothetical protein